MTRTERGTVDLPADQVNAPRGAYGLEVVGLAAPEHHLPVVPGGTPRLVLEHVPLGDRPRREPGSASFSGGRAEVWVGAEVVVEVDLDGRVARFACASRPADALLVHPLLATPAALVCHHLGRQVLHGGAFEHQGGAWCLLGDKEAGKSSTLAALRARGLRVLSDDLLVLDEGSLHPGPPTVDLRDDAAEALGAGSTSRVRPDRVRLELEQAVAAPVPLRGFVELSWGDAVTVASVGAVDRLELLALQRIVHVGAEPAAGVLDLAAHPVLRLGRPRDLDRIGAGVDALLGALA